MRRSPRQKSNLEETLVYQLKVCGLHSGCKREFKFHPDRRWRSDLAWPDSRLLVEVEGGNWSGGRHTRGAGYESDCEKYNSAVLLGYRVLRFTGAMVRKGEAVNAIEQALKETTCNAS
jgi:very-short-patch-repair endonuclease